MQSEAVTQKNILPHEWLRLSTWSSSSSSDGATAAASMQPSSSAQIWSSTSTRPMAKAASNPGLTLRENTSFPKITCEHASIFRLTSANTTSPNLQLIRNLQLRCAKEPSIRYSLLLSESWVSTSMVLRSWPKMEDLLTLNSGFCPSFLSPMNPSHL